MISTIAGTCQNGIKNIPGIPSCAKYAASSWSGGGIILLGAIVLLIIGVLNKSTRKPAIALLFAGIGFIIILYFKSKGTI